MQMTACKNVITYNRGDIFYANLGDKTANIGSEQCGLRPVIILQNDKGNLYSPTVIVAIITSKSKKLLPTHVCFYDTKILKLPSTICLEQIKTIDKTTVSSLEEISSLYLRERKQIDSVNIEIWHHYDLNPTYREDFELFISKLKQLVLITT